MKKNTLIFITVVVCAAVFWHMSKNNHSTTPTTYGIANAPRQNTTATARQNQWFDSPVGTIAYGNTINYRIDYQIVEASTNPTISGYQPLSTSRNNDNFGHTFANSNYHKYSTSNNQTHNNFFSSFAVPNAQKQNNQKTTQPKNIAQATPRATTTTAPLYTPFRPMLAPPPVIGPDEPEPDLPDIGIEDAVDDGHGLDLCPIGSELWLLLFVALYIIYKQVFGENRG